MLACDVAGFEIKDHLPFVRKIVAMPSASPNSCVSNACSAVFLKRIVVDDLRQFVKKSCFAKYFVHLYLNL